MNKIPKDYELKYFEVDGNITKFVFEDKLGIEHEYINQEVKPELPTYEELEDRINKAIEYIEERFDYVLKDESFLDHDDLVERRIALHLLNILKDKE